VTFKDTEKERAVIKRLIHWAEKHDSIRAMLLYGSRANPEAVVDIFSDYDVLLAVSNVRRFYTDDRWLNDFGRVLVVFRNPIGFHHGFESFGFITHYVDGVKVDYGFYPVEYLVLAAQEPKLPDDLDNGYIVLFDKDHLTAELKPVTYTAYIPCPLTEQEYVALIEEFFNDSAYVAKHLFKEIEAVAGISFSVERGEIFGLLGPNGAGKTTTASQRWQPSSSSPRHPSATQPALAPDGFASGPALCRLRLSAGLRAPRKACRNPARGLGSAW
jgi:ABC-type multidrug transport system fused ATPase/permease subunit